MAPHKTSTKASRATRAARTPKKTEITIPTPEKTHSAAVPPSRAHHTAYHYPLLLEGYAGCKALLDWFSIVEETRNMPWRKPWIDPKDFEGRDEELGKILGRRAYEVWVSEVMLQQTRVSTVIPYFNTWVSNWPTVQDLAEAKHDDVLAAWKGLGYYSRATRLHEGAKAMIAKSRSAGLCCPLPSKAIDLQEFPGIGRYTAGAVSSIAFGEAEPVLDGNVARVLSRQLGLYVDAKDKKASDILWEEADRLIKHVSNLSETDTSAIPGNWNQAMMELGSTICTPKPQCAECPVQSTCRAFGEGQLLSVKQRSMMAVEDIEDACKLCEPLTTEELLAIPIERDEVDRTQPTKKRKVSAKQNNTISHYFGVAASKPGASIVDDGIKHVVDPGKTGVASKRKVSPSIPVSEASMVSSIAYCSLFPKKVAKKKAAEDECVVCIIEACSSAGQSKWLIEQRPAKGLLASLWYVRQAFANMLTWTRNSVQIRLGVQLSGLRDYVSDSY
ncbi:DNA glycosylase [Phaeosphaeria sp. MPI-PUGE-AT-0046c]|nr:DNA glycosylase [Phaeosphaeria sp. MPI-PUGE-AT-0046c]